MGMGRPEGLPRRRSVTARLGYPLASCSPAELASVSPSDGKVAAMLRGLKSMAQSSYGLQALANGRVEQAIGDGVG